MTKRTILVAADQRSSFSNANDDIELAASGRASSEASDFSLALGAC